MNLTPFFENNSDRRSGCGQRHNLCPTAANPYGKTDTRSKERSDGERLTK